MAAFLQQTDIAPLLEEFLRYVVDNKISEPRTLIPALARGVAIDQNSAETRAVELEQPSPNSDRPRIQRGLFIGIDYVGQEGVELRGCRNDAKKVEALCASLGFTERRLMLDNAPNPEDIPTRENILNAIVWLLDGIEAGDSLFFHYSGHGAQLQCQGGEENDNMDETIVPVDFRKEGQIVDDVLFNYLVAPVPRGARLTALTDCCHSGSVLDLPFTVVVPKESERVAEEGHIVRHDENWTTKCVKYCCHPTVWAKVKNEMSENRDRSLVLPPTLLSCQDCLCSDVLLLSGCLDEQTSADVGDPRVNGFTFTDGLPGGACTYAFLEAMQEPGHTYATLLSRMRVLLQPKFAQVCFAPHGINIRRLSCLFRPHVHCKFISATRRYAAIPSLFRNHRCPDPS